MSLVKCGRGVLYAYLVAFSAFADNHSLNQLSETGLGDEGSFKASGLVVRKSSDVTYLTEIGYLDGQLIFLDDSFGAELINTEWTLSCIYRAELSPDANIDWTEPGNIWNDILVGCDLVSDDFGKIRARAFSDNFQMPKHILFDFLGSDVGRSDSRWCTLSYRDAPINGRVDHFEFSAGGNCKVSDTR